MDRRNADDAVTVRHGIDATKIGFSAGLGGGCRRSRWDSIVWNFPYPAGAGSAGTHSAAVCSQLLSDFFASAKACLKPAGRVYVTTLNRQKAVGLPVTPDWNIEIMASEAGLELEDVSPFNNTCPNVRSKTHRFRTNTREPVCFVIDMTPVNHRRPWRVELNHRGVQY